MSAPKQLSTEELTALYSVATMNGAHWKSALRSAWMNGEYFRLRGCGPNCCYSGVLQRLRNDLEFGPRGLDRFRLPKDFGFISKGQDCGHLIVDATGQRVVARAEDRS